MDTEQLIEELDRAKKIEKRADRVYTNHIEKISSLKDIDNRRKTEIIKVLKELRDDTERQFRSIEELERNIIEDNDNGPR